VGMDRAPFERLYQYFNWRTKMRHFPGITCGVVRNGMLVYYQESGYSNVETKSRMTGDTIVRLFSMTKCLVAAAFMTYVEDPSFGIDLDDPVSKYIPAFEASKMSVLPKRGQKENQPLERPITMRQLLSHTSGIGYGATLGDPWPPQKGSYYKIYEELCDQTASGQITNLEQWCNALAKVPLKGQPGHFWDYSFSLDVLGRVLEIIAGKTLDVVIEERICGPLKMRDTGFQVPVEHADRVGPWYQSTEVEGKPNQAHTLEILDKGGLESGWVGSNISTILSGGGTVEVPLNIKGGMVSTFNDYLRFLLMLRNFGELDGVRVMKRETVQLMCCNHIPVACNGKKTVYVFDKPGMGYSCLGSVQSQHPKQDKGVVPGEYGWGGLAGPAWTIDPRCDIIILTMTQTALVLDHEEYLRYAARRALHQYNFGLVSAPNKATAYPPETFDVLKPKSSDVAKADEQTMDKEFEEEYDRVTKTRVKGAKECAILPGARLDRHPSDEADAMSARGGDDKRETEAMEETTPAAKRRRSVAVANVDSEQQSTSKKASANTPRSEKKSPPSAPPDKLEEPNDLLFSRVVVQPAGELREDGMLRKARVTAIVGDAIEVITEGSWAAEKVKLGDISVIDETQFGLSKVTASDPTTFPMPQKGGM